MAIDKKLALAFDFKDAPKEVQDAAKQHRENWLRLEKARDQFGKWQSEVQRAEAAYVETQKLFDSAVDNWDPANKKNTNPEVRA